MGGQLFCLEPSRVATVLEQSHGGHHKIAPRQRLATESHVAPHTWDIEVDGMPAHVTLPKLPCGAPSTETGVLGAYVK